MKHLYLLLLSLICIQASAYDFEYNGLYYNVVSATNKTCEVTSPFDNQYLSSQWCSNNFAIPEIAKFNGIDLNVIGIGKYAFYYQYALIDIIIPEHIQYLGENAFTGCKNLRSLKLPSTLSRLGNTVFSSCSALLSIEIPNSISEIPQMAFMNCTNLRTVILPNTLTTIGYSSFENCTSLKSIILPTDLTYLGREAFNGCNSLTDIYYLSENPITLYTAKGTPLISSFPQLLYLNATLHIKCASNPVWQTLSPWKDFLNKVEYDASYINSVEIDDSEPMYYISISGQKSSTPFKGINIVVYSTGAKTKVYIP